LYVDELQPQTRQIHHKYQQGKEDSCDALKKNQYITLKGYLMKELKFSNFQYSTCEIFEELICKKIARLTYME
jgi:hypothetical protein